tara:strand:- start:69 stop:488 length:420 start_codon:yes stop_codon:yes gene_type:complete
VDGQTILRRKNGKPRYQRGLRVCNKPVCKKHKKIADEIISHENLYVLQSYFLCSLKTKWSNDDLPTTKAGEAMYWLGMVICDAGYYRFVITQEEFDTICTKRHLPSYRIYILFRTGIFDMMRSELSKNHLKYPAHWWIY